MSGHRSLRPVRIARCDRLVDRDMRFVGDLLLLSGVERHDALFLQPLRQRVVQRSKTGLPVISARTK